MCLFSDSLLFLGSILTNSKLLKLKEINKEEQGEQEIKVEPEKKKRKIETTDNYSESLDYMKQLELDEMELEIQEEDSIFKNSKESKYVEYDYEFESIDDFLNYGPVSSFTVVESPNEQDDKILEIVGCSGSGENGSLNILKRSVKPESLTQIDVKDVQQLFTLKLNETKFSNYSHLNDSYLVMSLSNSTQIYKITEGLSPLKNTDFILKERTLNAGNVLNGSYSVQICSTKFRILEKEKMKMEKELTLEVHSSCIFDPFILCLYNDGTISLFEVKKDLIQMLDPSSSLTIGFGRITAATLFKKNEEYFLFICWSIGAIEIYDLPNFNVVFFNSKFTSNVQNIDHENLTKSEKQEFSSLKEKIVIYPYVKEVVLKEFKGIEHLMV
jgi:cleavage and polyadenylation specificity factor subunit 1